MLRYLNMFILIGIALIGISIAGLATGNRFLTEPGQAQSPYASLIYLGAGLLMLVNGVISIRMAPPPQPARPESRAEPAPEPPDAAETSVSS